LIQNNFSMGIIIEGGIFQLLDPFSLQAYASF
jgi:hypothetical protein